MEKLIEKHAETDYINRFRHDSFLRVNNNLGGLILKKTYETLKIEFRQFSVCDVLTYSADLPDKWEDD